MAGVENRCSRSIKSILEAVSFDDLRFLLSWGAREGSLTPQDYITSSVPPVGDGLARDFCVNTTESQRTRQHDPDYASREALVPSHFSSWSREEAPPPLSSGSRHSLEGSRLPPLPSPASPLPSSRPTFIHEAEKRSRVPALILLSLSSVIPALVEAPIDAGRQETLSGGGGRSRVSFNFTWIVQRRNAACVSLLIQVIDSFVSSFRECKRVSLPLFAPENNE